MTSRGVGGVLACAVMVIGLAACAGSNSKSADSAVTGREAKLVPFNDGTRICLSSTAPGLKGFRVSTSNVAMTTPVDLSVGFCEEDPGDDVALRVVDSSDAEITTIYAINPLLAPQLEIYEPGYFPHPMNVYTGMTQFNFWEFDETQTKTLKSGYKLDMTRFTDTDVKRFNVQIYRP
jgi:hypothetical protein